MMPERIQRKRTKGWRMPAGAVYVGRPTRWGNPFKAGDIIHVGPGYSGRDEVVRDAAHAAELYQNWLFTQRQALELVNPLVGKDLACWCPLGEPCHADVLLRLANHQMINE